MANRQRHASTRKAGYLLLSVTAALMLVAISVLMIITALARIEYLRAQQYRMHRALALAYEAIENPFLKHPSLFTIQRDSQPITVTIVRSEIALQLPPLIKHTVQAQWADGMVTLTTVRP